MHLYNICDLDSSKCGESFLNVLIFRKRKLGIMRTYNEQSFSLEISNWIYIYIYKVFTLCNYQGIAIINELCIRYNYYRVWLIQITNRFYSIHIAVQLDQLLTNYIHSISIMRRFTMIFKTKNRSSHNHYELINNQLQNMFPSWNILPCCPWMI